MSDYVVEIGPGKGSLTRRLVPRVAHVFAIEKDEQLAEALRQGELAGRVTVIAGDALTVGWYSPDPKVPVSFKLVGNIPYQITSPLIERALHPPQPSVAVMLVQKEVAERLSANPDTREYGALTIGVQSVARVDRLFVVKAGAFAPPPKVDSAVVRFVPLDEPLVREDERIPFGTFVKTLFGQRRKQLIRSLREVAGLTKERAGAVLGRSGIPETARVEVLTPAQVVALFRATAGSHTL